MPDPIFEGAAYVLLARHGETDCSWCSKGGCRIPER